MKHLIKLILSISVLTIILSANTNFNTIAADDADVADINVIEIQELL